MWCYNTSIHFICKDFLFSLILNFRIVKEMTDLLCLDLFDKQLITESITLYIGYSKDLCPSTGGTARFRTATNMPDIIQPEIERLYREKTVRSVPIRRINLSCNNVISESYEQYDLFTDPVRKDKQRRMQRAVLEIKTKYGSTAVMKGMNLLEAGTSKERLHQIGGHKSGI
nr:hypothetical protein [uncultured Agathobacter sp.]